MHIESVLSDPAQLKALTTLTPGEFTRLLLPFGKGVLRRRKRYKLSGERRRAPASPRRLARPTKVLPTDGERLLFILLALKTDATQQHLGLTFAAKQRAVSQWYRFLLPVLDEVLRKLGCRPARTLDELVASLRSAVIATAATAPECDKPSPAASLAPVDRAGSNPADASLHMDVTGRRIPRNHDREAQRGDYSGKFRYHAVKNTVICDTHQRIVYLGPTWRGAIHDKRMADEELPDLSPLASLELWLTLDAGYLGYRPAGVHLLASQRATRGHPLTDAQKGDNQWVGSIRIIVEHAIGAVKRLAKAARARAFNLGRTDRVMQIAASLHNFRVEHRLDQYHVSHMRTCARLRPFEC